MQTITIAFLLTAVSSALAAAPDAWDEPKLTLALAKAALLDMMRSEAGKKLAFHEKSALEELAKAEMEKKPDGKYLWTAACRVEPAAGAYTLYVSFREPKRLLLKHGRYGVHIHARVYQGTISMKDGRWMATVPQYKYSLLD